LGRNRDVDVEEGSRNTFEPSVTGAPLYIIRRLPVFTYDPEVSWRFAAWACYWQQVVS
jgi:hypothetical protein